MAPVDERWRWSSSLTVAGGLAAAADDVEGRNHRSPNLYWSKCVPTAHGARLDAAALKLLDSASNASDDDDAASVHRDEMAVVKELLS